MQEYADPVIDWLDAGRGILGRRLFRDVRFTRILFTLLLTASSPVMYTTPQRHLHEGPRRRRARLI